MSGETANQTGSAQEARQLLIDTQLPDFQARSFYAVVVDAPPEAAYRAVRDLDPRQVAQAVPAMQLMGSRRAGPVAEHAGSRPGQVPKSRAAPCAWRPPPTR